MDKKRQPNVLVFLPHDLGDWLHCCGHPSVRSPHLDRFAQQGVRAEQYFAGAPECTPSRGCMFTGLHCHQHGLMGLSNFGWSLRPEVKHLATRFREGGYQTFMFGMQHETADSPHTLGYEQIRAPSRHVEEVCDGLSGFFEETKDASKPWFVQAAFFNTHRPWPKATEHDPSDMTPPGWLPDTPAVRQDLADFHDDIARMDTAVGQALAALEASGQSDNTIVVFTSDHGLPFPRAKATLYDPGLRIPLLIRWPAGFSGSRTLPQMLSNLDLTPTLLELSGLPVPEGLSGQSFAPSLRGEACAEREAVFATLFYDVAYDPMHMVRTKTHKYLRSFAVTDADRAGADQAVLASHPMGQWVRVDDFDVLASAACRSLDVDGTRPPREELYDLQKDPLEQSNLVDDPEASEVLAAMRSRMDSWMEATDSPLLHGHVPPNEKQREAAASYKFGGPRYAKL